MADAEVAIPYRSGSELGIAILCSKSVLHALLSVIVCACIMSCSKKGDMRVEINSCVLRNRIVVLDRIVMKKALYVAFALPTAVQDLNLNGVLLCNDQQLATAVIAHFQGQRGNLVFDLPAEIPEGKYTVQIEAVRGQGEILARGSLTYNKEELRSTIGSKVSPVESGKNLNRTQPTVNATPTKEEISNGYIVFSSSPLEQFDGSRIPERAETIDRLEVRAVRNEYEPVSFSIYPLRSIGRVSVTVSKLQGTHGSLIQNSSSVGHIEPFKGYPSTRTDTISNYPQVILPGDSAITEAGSFTRFWITLRIGDDVVPGEYRGTISITPEKGTRRQIPLIIIVEPVLLEDIPGKDYFMLMTYEFTELTMPWTEQEKKKIYEAAYNILKDYRAHGMTTVCIHSPFVLIRKEDGSPNLEDIYATLRAARDLGFTRPIIWYVGHLVQTAKPRHPGNITAFDAKYDLPRLKALTEDVTAYAKKHGCPEVIVLPIDEPDDRSQDPQGMRRDITPELLRTIKASGARTMITSRTADEFGPVDFLDSSEFNERELKSAHREGRIYWLYNNEVTTTCDNLAYARYLYGYYTWKTGIDGMSSWTFQNTQNARGQPDDAFLAYPNPAGPLPKIKWEAIREGVDDHKLIHQLEKRIVKLKSIGASTAKYEKFLDALKSIKNMRACNQDSDDVLRAAFFQSRRDDLINLIIQADKATAMHIRSADVMLPYTE